MTRQNAIMPSVASIEKPGRAPRVWPAAALILLATVCTPRPTHAAEPSRRITSAGFEANGTFALEATAEDSGSYRVETSEDLHHWLPLITAEWAGKLRFFDPASREVPHRFYRVVRWHEPASVKVVHVDATYRGGTPDGSVERPFPGVVRAHTAAGDGSRIRIRANTYPGPLLLTKAVLIEPEGGPVLLGP